MRRVLTLLVLMFLSAQAAADEQFRLWKAYAGEFSHTRASFQDRASEPVTHLPLPIRREIERNRRNNAVVPDVSVINCDRNTYFGIAYYVFFVGGSPANYDLTWYFPHLEKEKGKASLSGKITARMYNQKVRGQLYEALWDLEKEELKDGDFVLILHRGDKVLLRHVFQIRGCESPESAVSES